MEKAIDVSKNESKPQVQNKPPPSPSPSPSPSNPKIKEEDIKKLMDLSFSRDKAVKALTMAGGDVELAATLLFNNSI